MGKTRYQIISEGMERERTKAANHPPHWVSYNLGSVIPPSVKNALKSARGTLYKTQKVGAGIVDTLESVKSFVRLMGKLESALKDAVSAIAKTLASQIRDFTKQIESTGIYLLPIVNITHKKQRESKKISLTGPWWSSGLGAEQANELLSLSDKLKDQMTHQLWDYCYQSNGKGYYVLPQTFEEFKRWLAKKFREDHEMWVFAKDKPDSASSIWNRFTSNTTKGFQDVGAPYTPYGQVHAWIIVTALPDLYQFSTTLATMSQLTGVFASDMATSASMFADGCSKIKNKVVNPESYQKTWNEIIAPFDQKGVSISDWGSPRFQETLPPYWVGANVGMLCPELFNFLNNLADRIAALEYPKQLTFLDSFIDTISGLQNSVLSLMELVQQIDKIIYLLQQLMSMPGLYCAYVSTEVCTDSLINTIMALPNPWLQASDEAYRKKVAAINNKYDTLRNDQLAVSQKHTDTINADSGWLSGFNYMASGLSNPTPAWHSALIDELKKIVDQCGWGDTLDLSIRKKIAQEAYAKALVTSQSKKSEFTAAVEALASSDRAIGELENKRTAELADALAKKAGPLANVGNTSMKDGQKIHTVAPTDATTMAQESKMYYLGFVIAACAPNGAGAIKSYSQAAGEEYKGEISPVMSASDELGKSGKEQIANTKKALKVFGIK